MGRGRRAHSCRGAHRGYVGGVGADCTGVEPRGAAERTVRNGPLDIVMLTHDRLDHLVAAVDALEACTPEPYRLTVVDNASGPEVRNWLADNRDRFERLILRPTNEYVPAFAHGIEATASDPFVVTDPDVVVPELEPSWLARMLDLVDRHPDFGLIGIGLDQANRPPVLGPEAIDPTALVDGEIVEAGVGTVFQFIRRDALLTGYRSDGQACTDVRRTGYRVGWAPGVRGLHLGWDDFELHPGNLLRKRGIEEIYGESYAEVGLVRRPPSLDELALAAPVVAELRRLGVADASVLELAWPQPVVGAVLPEAFALASPSAGALPFRDRAAGAAVLTAPPPEHAREALAESCRVAARAVVALAPLEAFEARTAAELAPPGWRGREVPAVGDLALALARRVGRDPSLRAAAEASTAEASEAWLSLFAAAAFGPQSWRMRVWERTEPGPVPEHVAWDPARVVPWRPEPMEAPPVRRRGWATRAWRRLDIADRVRVWDARLRRRARPDGRG